MTRVSRFDSGHGHNRYRWGQRKGFAVSVSSDAKQYGTTHQGVRVRIYRRVNDHYVVRPVMRNGKVQRLAQTLPANEITLDV